MFSIKVGLTVFLSLLIPTSFFMRMIFGGKYGMYGTFFKDFPPAVFLSVNFIITFLIPYMIILVFIKKTDLVTRLPQPIPGRAMFLLCSFVILLSHVLTTFTSIIEGSSTTFALMNLMLMAAAQIALFLAVIKLLMAVKPHEKYVYLGQQS